MGSSVFKHNACTMQQCSPWRSCRLPVSAEQVLPISIHHMRKVLIWDILGSLPWGTFLWHSGRVTCKVGKETRQSSLTKRIGRNASEASPNSTH